MKNLPDISDFYKKYRHLLTVQNVGLLVALVVALAGLWATVDTLQRNYRYQRETDLNVANIKMMELQNQNYQYQQAYLKSDEYLELSARRELGLAQPGERLVILPSSEGIKDVVSTTADIVAVQEKSNFSRWLDFFFGYH